MSQEQPKFNEKEMLGSIEEFNEEINRQLDEIDRQEAEFEKRRKPLPEKLYHVTTRQNAQKILREGIDPNKLMFEDREVVSLADDIDFAIGVARQTQKTSPGNLVVLEIETRHLRSSRIHNYLRKADPKNKNPLNAAEIHEVHYEATIDPEAINIINPKKK